MNKIKTVLDWDLFFASKQPTSSHSYNSRLSKTIKNSVYIVYSHFEELSSGRGGAIFITSSSDLEQCIIVVLS